MKLREWLFRRRLSITYFAAVLKIDRSYVHMWLKGSKIPSDELMAKVREITCDQVYEKGDLQDEKRCRKNQGIDSNIPPVAEFDEGINLA